MKTATLMRRRRATGFSPLSLFSGGANGVLINISPGYLFQDAAGTVAAGVGDPVRYYTDTSGNGNHLVSPSDAARAVLRQTAGGAYYVEPDGVDDYAVVGGLDLSAFSHVGAWESANAFGGLWGTSNDTKSAFVENVNSTIRADDAVWGAVELTGVTNGIGPYTLAVTRSATTQARLNGVAGATVNNLSIAGSQNGLALFSRRTDTGSAAWAGRFFGGVWIDVVLNPAEIAYTEAYYAALTA